MLPPVVFVLGKGGVGRSTVAAGLGLASARQGKRTLVMQWALADPVSPWFGRPAAGYAAQALLAGLETMRFSAEAALEQYFVEHLHLRAFHRAFIANRHVRKVTRAAPGLEELMFLGTIMWLTTLAREDRGWVYERVVVDAPAMGHGASLFAIPHATKLLGLGGLLVTETERVSAMLADPKRTAALVVTTPDELAVEETLEFWPRVTRDLGRPPAAVVMNRDVSALGPLPREGCAWLIAAGEGLAPEPRAGLSRVYAHLARRAERERGLQARLSGVKTVPVADALLLDASPAPIDVVGRAAAALAPLWGLL